MSDKPDDSNSIRHRVTKATIASLNADDAVPAALADELENMLDLATPPKAETLLSLFEKHASKEAS